MRKYAKMVIMELPEWQLKPSGSLPQNETAAGLEAKWEELRFAGTDDDIEAENMAINDLIKTHAVVTTTEEQETNEVCKIYLLIFKF